MISENLREYAFGKLEDRRQYYKPVWDELVRRLGSCSEEEAVLMRFLYGTMPVRDAGEYDFDVFYGYVRHALWLREHVEWCRELPEDIFVHYVLYYRINSEDISDCRAFFYERLKERIAGKSMEEAVLEINVWCAEHVVYEATDGRTASPVTMYRCGRGRCGEESTFTVTALRSVGIPARQVYTPRWAHCDDNHAWVEVFIGKSWYFLGACEPEAALNMGWFTGPASRAVLIHSRTFSDFASSQSGEYIGREDLLSCYNNTSLYAKTCELTIAVRKPSGEPACDAFVALEILNMAEFSGAAVLRTDEKGEARITVGRGDVHLRAWKGELFAEAMASPQLASRTELRLGCCESEPDWVKDEWEQLQVTAPEEYPMHPGVVTKKQKEDNARRVEQAALLREQRFEALRNRAMEAAYPQEAELLRMAGENAQELICFLSADENPDRRLLLHSLPPKDYKDLRAEILEDHLSARRGSWPEETYQKYVLCPRIYLEELTKYRSFIRGYFSQEEKERFTRNPETIWKFIKNTITYAPEADYKTICATPTGCLRLRHGSPLACRILFVAICRSLDIPARLDRATLVPEYNDGGGFRTPSGFEPSREAPPAPSGVGPAQEASSAPSGVGPAQEAPPAPSGVEPAQEAPSAPSGVELRRKALLTLSAQEEDHFVYYQSWTIARLDEVRFRTLDYEGISFQDRKLTLKLEPGIYRIITTCRMPDSSQRAALRVFLLSAGENKTLELTLPEAEKDIKTYRVLEDFQVKDVNGEDFALSELTEGGPVILAFLGVGAEPTEHVLNELLENAGRFNSAGARMLLVLRDPKELANATLHRVLETVKGLKVYFDNGNAAERTAAQMGTDPEKLPVMVALAEGLAGCYACSGYNVGSVSLMLKILKRLAGTGRN